MAGTDSRFDATRFRDAIHFAMHMGMPDEMEKRVTWQWTTERTFNKADSGGSPFEWSAAEVESSDSPVEMVVDCAVKFQPSASSTRVGGTTLGIMDTESMIVTMLDTEFDGLVTHGGRRPDQATVDGNVYVVQFVAPEMGLFDVTIYQIYLQAIDES